MDSNLVLFIGMLHNQSIYVAARIENKNNRKIYLDTIDDLLHDPDLYHKNTYESRKEFYSLLPQYKEKKIKWDFWGNKMKYRNLAFDHLADIIKSIDIRFVNGGTKSYDIW